jgi:hypothetical protein
MNTDKVPTNSKSQLSLEGGDTGRKRVEHRSLCHLRFTQTKRTG